jgi:hypothetical protein
VGRSTSIPPGLVLQRSQEGVVVGIVSNEAWVVRVVATDAAPHPRYRSNRTYAASSWQGTESRGGNDKITKNILLPFWLFFTWDP